jgi:hypothetical protein
VSFTAGALGATTFQWRRNGVPLLDGGRVSGTSTPTLTIAAALSTDNGLYSCVASNSCFGQTSADARLTLNSADFNGDADTGTDADIEAFFSCLSGSCCPTCGSADFNGDNDVGTDADIESFFRVLGGGNC